MKVDWTRQKRPWFEDGFYKLNYKTDLFSKNAEDYKQELSKNIRRALVSLFNYYNRTPEGIDEIAIANENPEIYVDPRPICGHIHILLEVPEDALENAAKSRDLVIPADAKILNTNTLDFIEKCDNVSKLLGNYQRNLEKSGQAVYVEGVQVDLRESIEKILNYPANLSYYFKENSVSYDKVNPVPMVIVFDNSYRFSGVIYNNEDLLVGVNEFSDSISFRNFFANRAIINLEILNNIHRQNSGRVVLSKEPAVIKAQWRDILRLMPDTRIGPDQSLPTDDKNFHQRVGDRFLERNFGQLNNNIFRENYWRKKFNLLEQNRISIGGDCGNLSPQDIQELYKTVRDKNVEDAIGDIAEDRITIWEETIGLDDFVGDRVYRKISDPSYAPGDFEELYENVLNHISFDLLLKKVLECLQDDVDIDIPNICAELYFPFVLDFPDNLTIPDIFGAISDLILRALLLAIQEIIISIIETILDILRDCQIDLNELGYGGNEKEDYFKENLGTAEEDIARKVFDNFDDLNRSINAAELKDQTISNFLSDVCAALTPLELCSLVNGNPTEETLEVVICLIQIRYPDIHEQIDTKQKVLSLFKSLKPLFNSEICRIGDGLKRPTDASICKTSERDAMREALLASSGLTDKEIEKQIDAARSRREQEINSVKDLFNQDNRQDLLNQGKSPEDFAKQLSPCASENENMRHMVEISVDSSIRSIEKMYRDALIGQDGLKQRITADGAKEDYKQDLLAPKFIEILADVFRILGGSRNSITYSQDVGTTRHGIRTRVGDFFYEPQKPSSLPNFGDASNWRISALQHLVDKNADTKTGFTPITPSTAGATAASQSPSTVPSLSTTGEVVSSDGAVAGVGGGLVGNTNATTATQDFKNNYAFTFKEVSSAIAKIVSSSNMLKQSSSTIDQEIDDTIPSNSPPPMFENCWLPDGESVRQKIADTYFDLECQTRDPNILNESMITGMIYLYSRSLAIEYVIQNFAIISDFHSSALANNFAKQYLSKAMDPIRQYLSESRFIDDADKLIQDQLNIVMDEVWKEFDRFVIDGITPDSSNIYRYFLNSLPVITSETATTVRDLSSKFYLFLYEDENETSLRLRFVYDQTDGYKVVTLSESTIEKVTISAQGLGSFDVPDPASEGLLKELMLGDPDFKVVFNFIFPLNDILSIITIYSVLKFDTNSFDRLYKTIEFTIEALVNASEFTYRPDSLRNYNNNSEVSSKKSDKRSDVARSLSLPWLPVEVARIVF